jgi:hypothetical protein
MIAARSLSSAVSCAVWRVHFIINQPCIPQIFARIRRAKYEGGSRNKTRDKSSSNLGEYFTEKLKIKRYQHYLASGSHDDGRIFSACPRPYSSGTISVFLATGPFRLSCNTHRPWTSTRATVGAALDYPARVAHVLRRRRGLTSRQLYPSSGKWRRDAFAIGSRRVVQLPGFTLEPACAPASGPQRLRRPHMQRE